MSDTISLPFLDVFISQYESAETKRAYTREVHRFFKELRKDLAQITKADSISYVQKLKNESLKPRSIARSIYAVRSYLKFLVSMEILAKNPMDGIRLPRISSVPEQGLTNEEISSMVESFSKRNKNKNTKLDCAVFYLMLYNGLRRSEICGINYGDIRKDNGVFVIEIRGKGGKTRVRPIHAACLKAIIEYLKHDNRQIGRPEDPVFIDKYGKRIEPHHIYSCISRVARKAKLKRRIHPHMLRAKFASMALESGQPITSVQADMGHSSIETTAIYDKAKHNLERSAVLRIKEIKPVKHLLNKSTRKE